MNSKKRNHKYYKTYWNDNMSRYLDQSAGGRWFDYLLMSTLDKVSKRSVKSVADIGCGVGNKTATMADYFKKAEVTGYDFSEEGIATAKRMHKAKNVKFKTEDITPSKYKQKMSFLSRRMHDVWYVLFRYFSFKNKGDIFVGLFEKK